MSSIHGKNGTVFRKQKTSTKLSSSPTYTQDIKFAHQTSAGDTLISLDSLTLPTQMTEFVNPTGTELAAINLKSNANSLILTSSIRTLICDVDYKINTSRNIELLFSAAEGEIFTGQMRTTQATANIVDGETYTCTGTLTAGNTSIALGQAFTLNANPTKQLGDIILYIDGVLQFRNVGNATAAPAADGNYEEVDAGAGLTNSLELNSAYGVDVAWAVVSTGVIVDNSNISNQQQLDALGGQIDSMVPTLAALAGVPETDFQAGPNSIDLKAFGDRLFTAEGEIDTAQTDITDLQTNKQDAFEIKWQKKTLSADLSASSGTNADLSFNNLEVGKTYRVSGKIFQAQTAGVVNISVELTDGAQIVDKSNSKDVSGQEEWGIAVSTVFTATTTSLDFVYAITTGFIRGNGTTARTHLTLEELPNHTVTTDWT